jgi:sodium transport system permease protein
MVLYPGILWILFSAITFVEGQADTVTARVAVRNLPDEHAGLRTLMMARQNIRLADTGESDAALERGDIDVILDFYGDSRTREEADARSPDVGSVVLIYDGARERSRTARFRIERVLEDYREGSLLGTLRTSGLLPAEVQQFWIEQQNVASDREMGGFFLGMFVPTFMIVMIGVGAMYPAVDTTAGERETSTWETLLTTGVSRRSIVIAKYLYVATMSLTAGLLNLAAMSLTLGGVVEALSGDTRFQVVLPLGGVLVIVLGTALLALFMAAGMMILASFARTFKEGQSMVAPLYAAIFIPVMFLQSPTIGLTPALALVPVVNVALMIREAVAGIYQWPLIGLTFLVEIATVVVALAFATRILRQEGFVLGTHPNPLTRFWRRRRRTEGPRGGSA